MIPFLGEAFKDLTSPSKTRIDNFVFRLNYIFLSSMLFGSSGILLTSQLFGDPIDCFSDDQKDWVKETIDKFCWVEATYTIPELYSHSTKFTTYGPLYDGVGQFDSRAGNTQQELQYRWIFFLLFMEGLCLYLPHYIWKYWEKGRMAAIAEPFDSPYDSLEEAVVEALANKFESIRDKRMNQLTDSFAAWDVNKYCRYTFKLYACEALNLFMLCVTFYATDSVLGNHFSTTGIEIMRTGWTKTTVDRLFPDHAKCWYSKGGPSGSKQVLDALCVLPLNAFSRLVFKCLWFAMVGMMVLTSLVLVFRLITIVFKPTRAFVLRMKVASYRIIHTDTDTNLNKQDLSQDRNPNKPNPSHDTNSTEPNPSQDRKNRNPHPSEIINEICKKLPHGDWYVLYKLADNFDWVEYQRMLKQIYEKLDEKKTVSGTSDPTSSTNSNPPPRRPTVPDVTCVPNNKPDFSLLYHDIIG